MDRKDDTESRLAMTAGALLYAAAALEGERNPAENVSSLAAAMRKEAHSRLDPDLIPGFQEQAELVLRFSVGQLHETEPQRSN